MREEHGCSARSLAHGESLHATASRVRRWVLVEQPGPWGPDAVVDNRMAAGVAAALRGHVGRTGARLLLVRRPGRSAPNNCAAFVAYTGPEAHWVEHGLLDGPADLLDVDLTPLRDGVPTGFGAPLATPLHVVCTNGARDPCCARYGRPVAAVLAERYGRAAWEATHVGGDRFAANLVAFPHGLYFGRLSVEQALEVAALYARGEILLVAYRGRAGYPPAVQAAEIAIRRAHHLRGVDDLILAGAAIDGTDHVVVFRGGDRAVHTVRLRVQPDDVARPLTCHADVAVAPRTTRILELRRELQPR